MKDVKTQYEARAEDHIAKIGHLKMTLDELKAKTEMDLECIRALLHSHKDRFVRQLKEAINRGWAEWAKQAAELHTLRVDQENPQKEGKGFYKLMRRVSQ